MSSDPSVLFCHCSYAKVLSPDDKDAVFSALQSADVDFQSVPDLCEMSARQDPELKTIASNKTIKIAACHERAVKWLFHAGDAPLKEDSVEVFNMRDQTSDSIISELVGKSPTPRVDTPAPAAPIEEELGEWKPWFPVIDYDRCTNCMQCLSFCLFDVYSVDQDDTIKVQNQNKCKTNCPACSRVCPEVAIMFPKYKASPINGDAVQEDDVRREHMKVDISSLLGGDIYATLRDRSERARSRFSKERSEDRALKERTKCLKKLKEDLDIPDDVLAALPSMDVIQAKFESKRTDQDPSSSDND